MKILVNCYACSPYQGSEPGMGWNFVKCLSSLHELHILTETKFQADIEKYFLEHPTERDRYHFYFIKRTRYNLLRKIWPPSYYWTYKQWQKKALEVAKRLDENEKFDLVHQLNMAGYREPGYLWAMDKPFVWGPIGGFDNLPWSMLPSMGLYGTIYYTAYNLINTWQKHSNIRVKKAMQKASALISATQSIQAAIEHYYAKDSVIIPEVGLLEAKEVTIGDRVVGEKLKICWSGLHIPRKSLNILLEAVAMLKRDDVELHVIGEGPCTAKWKTHARKLGLSNVTWHGWIKRDEALNVMRSSHLFCITSLSDLTSTVILEALSLGLPTIALDHCGFSNVLTNECGIRIPVENYRQVVEGIAQAIQRLIDNEGLRKSMALAARERSLNFSWDFKAEQINEIYSKVCRK